MQRRKGRYTEEFKSEAVRLARSVKGERSIRQVARELGISNETLRAWIKQSEIDAGEREGLTIEELEELRRLRKENRILREERRNTGKSSGLLRLSVRDRPDPVAAFEFVRQQQANYSVQRMCEILRVSSSGFYAWKLRRPSKRQLEDEMLTKTILDIHRKLPRNLRSSTDPR